MRGQAMKKVCNKLVLYGEDLSRMDALEFFARTGEWQTIEYVNQVNSLSAWEISPEYEKSLRENLPNANIEIDDSFSLAKDKKYRNKFQFIVFDNPQNVFNSYCEHFEAIELVPLLSKGKSIVIFNVNLNPFNYDSSPEWKSRRQEYYGSDADSLSIDFLIGFYKRKFIDMGLDIRFCFEEKRNDEYLSYLVMGIENNISSAVDF